MLRRYLPVVVLLTLFPLLIAAILYSRPFPKAGTLSTGSQEFSSARAMIHVQQIARAPHPIGTAAHAEIERYILGEIRNLGFAPQIEESPILFNAAPQDYRVAYVRNIVVKIPGKRPTKSLLVTAHYDSMNSSPGAADDGAAVAAILEILRALSSKWQPGNDVVFLFSDGEEYGLFGAKAFVEQSKQFSQIGLVLNFEARGSSGPSIMFESSADNAWLLSHFTTAAQMPYATSLTSALYRLLPLSTDFTIYRKAKIPGLNFAFAEDWNTYHSSMDTAERLDPRSLQHHGMNGLALVREFAMLDLSHIPSGSAEYFNIFGRTLLSYRRGAALSLAAATTLVFLTAIVLKTRSKAINIKGIALGLLYPLCCLATVGLACWLLFLAIRNLIRPYKMRADVEGTSYYLLAFAVVGVTLAFVLYRLFRTKTTWINLLTGSALIWFVVMWLTFFYVRGSSYLFTWPLLLVAAVLCFPNVTMDSISTKTVCAVVLAAIPVLLFLVPAIDLMFVAFNIPGGFLVASFIGLCAGMFALQMELIAMSNFRFAVGAMAAVAVGLLAVGTIRAARDAKFTVADHISYIENDDRKTAAWHTSGSVPDGWTKQFFSGRDHSLPIEDYLPDWFAPPASQAVMTAPATFVRMVTPEVSVAQDTKVGSNRRISLRIQSPGQAPQLFVHVNCDSGIHDALLNDEPLRGAWSGEAGPGERPSSTKEGSGRELMLSFYGIANRSVDLTLSVPVSGRISLSILEKYLELPGSVAGSITPRPSDIMPSRNVGDNTLLVKSYSF